MKYFSLLTIALSALCMNAQTALDDFTTYFYCDFTDGIPADFATYDLDGKTLHFSMTQGGLKKGESWVRVREEFSSPINYFAGSGSKHKYADGEEAAAADDWMITSQIWIKGSAAKLTWKGKSIGESKKTSSYSVYASTKGNKPEDFTDAPLLTVEDESASRWTTHEVSLEQFKGQKIYLAFVNHSLDKEILAIDNVKVDGEKGLCELLCKTGEYVFGTEEVTVNASLTAYSDEEINAFTAYYEYKGEVYSKEVSGIALKKHDAHEFTFDQTIPVAVGDTVAYKLWAKVNGITTDTIHASTISFLFKPERKVVVEEGTAMWCTFCPKGIVAMETLGEKYPDSFIGIAVHYDDAITVEDYCNDLYFPGYPSAYVNRKYTSEDIMKQVFIDGEMQYSMLYGGLETLFLQALSEQTLADVSLDADVSDGNIKATVTSRFAVSNDNADYQIAIVVIENDVTGNGYYQDNGYSGSSTPMFGYELLPDRILDPVFQEVARDVYDNYKGIAGSVPTAVVAGQDNVFEFTTAVPESVNNVDKIEVIAMLIDQQTGEIVNADIAHSTAGINDIVAEKAFNLDYTIDGETCLVEFNSDAYTPAQLAIYAVDGSKVYGATLRGAAVCPVNVAGLHGVHFITVNQDGRTAALKVAF